MSRTHPNVAPEPAIYCPSVRMMPLVPAPYRKMLTVPGKMLCQTRRETGQGGDRTENEADDYADGYRSVSGIRCGLRLGSFLNLLPPIRAPIFTGDVVSRAPVVFCREREIGACLSVTYTSRWSKGLAVHGLLAVVAFWLLVVFRRGQRWGEERSVDGWWLVGELLGVYNSAGSGHRVGPGCVRVAS